MSNPNKQLKKFEQRIALAARHFSGPLPPPEILERYNSALPDAAERIMRMAEQQSRHRQEMEKMVIQGNISSQKIGTILGFIIVMGAMGGGFWLTYIGLSAYGIASILGALATILSVFLWGKHEQRRDLQQKTDAFMVPKSQ